MSVCVVGSLNLDRVARVEALPRPGETVLGAALARHPGGKGLNQAIAAARAGAPVRMAGAVGADAAGDWLLERLEAAGVDARAVVRGGDLTGQALITVAADGENTIVVIPGANATARPSPTVAAGARVLLTQLEIALAPLAQVLAADLPGGLKILNAAPALDGGAELFRFCDILVLNETELARYARLPSPPRGPEAIGRAAQGLRASYPGLSVVVTLGADGALLADAAGDRRVPGLAAQVVDTVGAGDCFCGVLAAGLGAGLALPDAIVRANAAASLAVTRPGVSDAMPSGAEIDARLAG